MPRKARETSATGIYHVMLKGTNGQDIFEERADYWKFLKLLRQQTFPEDKQGHPLPPHCILYAYCLMTNHVHLLIRATEDGLSSPISSIAIAYALYFNQKYERQGHLFQDRFKSEPVNDMGYFVTLLRYIHQNPVAAGITKRVDSYTWSSWCEYDSAKPCALPVCQTSGVLNRMSLEELTEQVNDPLPKALNILDFNNEMSVRLSDEKVREFLASICSDSSPNAIQHYKKDARNDIIRQLKDFGASIRQTARITGVSEGIIRKIK